MYYKKNALLYIYLFIKVAKTLIKEAVFHMMI